MGDLADNLLDAVSIIVQHAVSQANFDRTIQALILSCQDQASGLYKVRYQDSIWLAYSTTTEITYQKGTSVYILVPGNDMSRNKTIIGTVSGLGQQYVEYVNNQDLYIQNGIGVIAENTNENELCSYVTEQKLLNLTIDTAAANEYLKNSDYILIQGDFRTDLPQQQQSGGNYGLKVYVQFENIEDPSIPIIREYRLDIDDMEGNPYLLTTALTQKAYFSFDKQNFKQIQKITFFDQNFINNSSQHPKDIFVSNIQITGVNMLTFQEREGLSLRMKQPQGYIFSELDTSTSTRDVVGQVRVSGKLLSSEVHDIDFYWFKQDISVDAASPYYSKYGKKGWRCLNEKITVQNEEIFLPAEDTYTIAKSDVGIQRVKYKCVAIYNNIEISNIFQMINLDSEYIIQIVTQDLSEPIFYSFSESIYIYCDVKTKSGSSPSNLTYIWKQVTQNNVFYTLNAQPGYPDWVAVYANNIRYYSDFYCTVYQGNNLIGNASIRFFKREKQRSRYVVTIQNGVQLFNYDEMGNSPFSRIYQDKNLTIPQLTFSIVDSENQEDVTDKVENYSWRLPLKNTLLVNKNPSEIQGQISNDGQYLIFQNLQHFAYGISDRYYTNQTNNNIILEIEINKEIVTAKTNFLFTKEGQPGTNGTGVICKIVGIKNDKRVSGWLINNMHKNTASDANVPNFNWDSLLVELWKDGQCIFSKNSSDSNLQINVTWGILSMEDNSWYQIDESTGVVQLNQENEICQDAFTQFHRYDTTVGYGNRVFKIKAGWPANIIKVIVEYNGRKYYDTAPIVTILTRGRKDLFLEPYSGFKYVTYSEDGENPRYDDTTPFFLNLIGNTQVPNPDSYSDPSWKVVGSIRVSPTNAQFEESINLIKNTYRNSQLINNAKIQQKFFKPISTYDGRCVTNAIVFYEDRSSPWICIHIPIHFMYNRYGHKNLNDWDGNSIKIDDQGNYILAPQIGAGKKDNETNTFTGLLMGSVVNGNTNSEQTGLFGYNAGERTIFLDAETGTAIFGKAGAGQIQIVPSLDTAILKSGNYNYHPGYNNGAGMQIDLSEPSIKFGNGLFELNSQGQMLTKKGYIGGWQLGSDANGRDYLYRGSDQPTIGNLNSNKNSIYLGSLGFSLGNSLIYNIANNSFYVSADSLILKGTGSTTRNVGDELTEAAKTATNYLFQSNGLVISKNGQNYATNNSYNTYFTNSGFYIRRGTTNVVALESSQLIFYKIKSNETEQLETAAYIGTSGLFVNKGQIANFTITNGQNTGATSGGGHVYPQSLYIHSNNVENNNVYEYQTGIAGSTTIGSPAFYVKKILQGANWSTAETIFYVNNKGKLYAQDADIKGKINATSGTIGGAQIVDGTLIIKKIQAEQGAIGGFTITNTANRGQTSANGGHYVTQSLYVFSNNTTKGKTYQFGLAGGSTERVVYVKSVSLGSNWNSTVTDQFYITRQGTLYARDANITGTVNATSGEIGILTVQMDGEDNPSPADNSTDNRVAIRMFPSSSNKSSLEFRTVTKRPSSSTALEDIPKVIYLYDSQRSGSSYQVSNKFYVDFKGNTFIGGQLEVYDTLKTDSAIHIGGGIYPDQTESRQIGSSDKKWNRVYAKNIYGTVQSTSDERKKDIIGDLKKYKTLFMKLKPIEFKWKEETSNLNIHFGVGAQTTEKILCQTGFKNTSLVTYEEDQYYVNYIQLQMLIIPVVQQHEHQIQNLKQKIIKLQKEIEELKGE